MFFFSCSFSGNNIKKGTNAGDAEGTYEATRHCKWYKQTRKDGQWYDNFIIKLDNDDKAVLTSSPTDTTSKNYTFLSCGCALLYVVPPEKVDELVANVNLDVFFDHYTQTKKKYHMDVAWVKHRLRSKWQELVNMRVKEAEDFEEKEKEGKERTSKEREANVCQG